MIFTYKFKLFFLLFTALTATSVFAQKGNFKVTLDAGHGGKDFGATYEGRVEKIVALGVALKVGKILEHTPGFDVVYTRKTDVFIDLVERANIANRTDSHIFVSIHCNANKNTSAYGTETYVMGPTKNASNLEVAKKENAVIKLEANYESKYAGFDLNNPAVLMIQEEYMDNSIALASRIQNHFMDDLDRKSRGVKPAPYMVLHKAYMPRVLIEMGFISNTEEGNFIESDAGQEKIAKAIANAIISYKKEYYGDGAVPDAVDKPSEKMEKTEASGEEGAAVHETPVTQTAQAVSAPESEDVIFKVQISASGKKLETVPSNFKGLNNVTVVTDNGTLYKYMYGETSDYEKARQLLAEARAKGFESAYVVAYRNGKRINIPDALRKG